MNFGIIGCGRVATDYHLPALNICIQVNVDNSPTKSGVTLSDLPNIIEAIKNCPKLALRGLMCIPQETKDFDSQRIPFKNLRILKDEIEQTGIILDTLSMGMSGDFHAAIAEGATIIRVGTALFGHRHYS